MSETKNNQDEVKPRPETQRERWVKYGANVALTVVVAVVLSLIVIYIAGRRTARLDTTAAGLYSLKPQTINLIKNNGKKVKLVGLYPKLKLGEQTDEKQDFYQPVADLLEEYSRKGKNIDAEMIDWLTERSKVDQLIEDFLRKSGKEVQGYKDVFAELPKTIDQLTKFAEQETKALGNAAAPESENDPDAQARVTALAVRNTIARMPGRLKSRQSFIEREMKEKLPDYKTMGDDLRTDLEDTSKELTAVLDNLPALANSKQPNLRDYAKSAPPRITEMKKAVDAVVDRLKPLGELKQLDELRKNVERRSILVLGENDMRVLKFDQVWQKPENARDVQMDAGDEEPRRQFAGEQQVTTAILALTTDKKHKVCFIRPGGPPLTGMGFPPFQPSGQFARVAERLRAYNFDVKEKDASGTWAMQAQMQQQMIPPEPEPSDEEIKDAVWVVLSYMPGMDSRSGQPNALGPKVEEHLKRGGSALVLCMPQADNLAPALQPWGVDVQADKLIVHEPVKSAGARSADVFEDAQRVPVVFVVNEYGNHPMTKALTSLDLLLVGSVPVKTTATSGIKATSLLPVPQSPKSWAEKDLQPAMEGEAVTFDAKSGDVENTPQNPLFVGAALEKDGGQRLVVLGNLQFATNRFVTFRDPRVDAARFPGNGELLADSVFWLSKLDTLIAISPAAMQVSRIENIPPARLKAWRWGVLVIGLPVAVVALGAMMYARRRD